MWAADNLPVPDPVLRWAVGVSCGNWQKTYLALPETAEADFVKKLSERAVAEHTDSANEQHYELPPGFFETVLGPRLKYSSCYYENPGDTLEQAEIVALDKTMANALLEDGQDILELGCGWGSLTLSMAQKFPNARITAVSNSAPQRLFIEGKAKERGLNNVTVITADMNHFTPEGQFDRIVSVEMFEHMSNWAELLGRVRTWMRDDARFFMHVFSHSEKPMFYDHTDPNDWIAQYFFTGGIMPSHGLIKHFGDLLELEEEWRWNGMHYSKTATHWLERMDANEATVRQTMREVYGSDGDLWYKRWRLFFLAVEGLFGHTDGEIWGVSHYRLKKA